MSLLDRGPHTAQVETRTSTKGEYNERVFGYADPVTVRCSVQPVRAEEAVALGVSPDTAYRVSCRSWPGGMYSRVTWQGRTWFQQGETQHHTMSPRTAHDTALIVAQAAEVA